jgi:hypothetical protein
MRDHPAKVLTDTDLVDRSCSVCGTPVERAAGAWRHVGEATARQVVPVRADVAVVDRAAVVAERALRAVVWSPHLTDADRARAVVDALYSAGLIVRRPRAVRPRGRVAARR